MNVKLKKIIRQLLLGLLVVFIILQFFRPEKNNSGNVAHDISTLYPVPANVQDIMKVACNDCHSNTTDYPWYANIQPVAWWLNDHIVEGKAELNFNEFSTYRIGRQYRKLEKLIEEVEEEEMPLSSYTIIHRNALLTDAQKTEITNWARGLREYIKTNNPPDSLIRPKKKNM